MLNLFENYREEEKDLENSLKQAGYEQQTIVLNEDGYLPEHVTSPISFFTGMKEENSSKDESPKFFNEISLPNYWEIKGDGQKAEIFEGYKKRGHINYNQRKTDYRAVKSVEWLNDSGRVRAIDLYNQYGRLFGRETYSDGQRTLTTYFDKKQAEVILLNHVTQTIQLNYKKKQYVFETYTDFIIFYLEESESNTREIFYNSLGRPFFITEALKTKKPNKAYNHTLFWQEESAEIPGNMRMILSDKAAPTKRIVVQNREEYMRIQQQIDKPTSVQIEYLGYLYNLRARKSINKSILILTNSDQIAKLNQLVEALPNYQFNIAARTTMSQKLHAFENYSNVQLYPTVDDSELEKLISESSFYLDINHGNEVEHIIRTAFENNQLILGFKETIHNQRYTSSENIFLQNDWMNLVQRIREVGKNFKEYRKALGSQWWSSGQSTIDDYKEVLK